MDPPATTPTPKRTGSRRSTTSSKKSSKRGSKKGSRRSMPLRQKSSYKSQALSWLEPRLLVITTGVTLLGVFLQIIAISTDSWLILDAPRAVINNNNTGKYLVEAYTGLWRLCRVEIFRSHNGEGKIVEQKVSTCERHNLFPTEEEIQESKEYERQHLDFDVKDMLKMDYTRTAIAFTIIAIVIMTIGHAFAFYALRRPRYIIKRLAALLHFMAAACLLVLNEVFVKTVEHEAESKQSGIPAGATTHFGYSFILSWLVFVFFVLAGLIFLFMSHKKKAEYADSNDAMEDEPMEIFRR